MKYLSIFFALFLSTSMFAQEDAISKYFSKYVDNEDFTVVYVSGKMFELINKMQLDFDDEEAEAILDVVKDLKGLRILTTENNGAKYYKEAISTINTNDFETLMTVREGKGENVQFLIKDDGGDIINELLLLVGGGDNFGSEGGNEFVLISFIGKIDLNQVGKLAKAFEDDNDSDHDDGENKQ
ncbi:MAG TPA: DUF4252 domain-containing protein [Bacteroidetes bacterium]|nr:DUF4252 domain-containing protein [Bacteroidota bacterium]